MSLLAEQGTAVVFSVLKRQNIHGDTALHIAVQMENTKALIVFLNSSDSNDHLELLNMRDKISRSAEMHNCGDPNKRRTLKSKGPCNCSTLLHMAASVGNDKLISCMLDNLKLPQERYMFVAAQNSIGCTALHTAVAEGHPSCIRAMLNPLPHDQREALLMTGEVQHSTDHPKNLGPICSFLQRNPQTMSYGRLLIQLPEKLNYSYQVLRKLVCYRHWKWMQRLVPLMVFSKVGLKIDRMV